MSDRSNVDKRICALTSSRTDRSSLCSKVSAASRRLMTSTHPMKAAEFGDAVTQGSAPDGCHRHVSVPRGMLVRWQIVGIR
jgi:hypothetical protein